VAASERKEKAMTEGNEVRATHEEVEGFVAKLKDFHSSLDESGQEMLDSILDSAQGEETGGYRKRRPRSGEGSEQPWNDLVGWIEEQDDEDAQGFIKRHRR
jgi:hypothetical protein